MIELEGVTECAKTVLNDNDNQSIQGISDEFSPVVLGRISSHIATLRDKAPMQGRVDRARTLHHESIPTQETHP